MIEWIKLFGSIAVTIFLVRYGIFGSSILGIDPSSWLVKYATSDIGLVTAFALGIGITALVHSSSVIIWSLMPLVATGIVHPHIGIAIVLGANIGTCVDGFMAWALFRTHETLLIAKSHLLFNVIGNSIMFPLFIVFRKFI